MHIEVNPKVEPFSGGLWELIYEIHIHALYARYSYASGWLNRTLTFFRIKLRRRSQCRCLCGRRTDDNASRSKTKKFGPNKIYIGIIYGK